MTAAQVGNISTLEKLISLGADLKHLDNYRNSMMHYAAINGRALVLRWLIEQSSVIDVFNNNGRSPLHEAARYAQMEIIEVFSELDLDLNAFDNNGNTAAHYLLQHADVDVLKHASALGIDFNIRNKMYGLTLAMQVFLFRDDREILLQRLHELKVNINAPNTKGETLVTMALKTGDYEGLMLLSKSKLGINLEQHEAYGETFPILPILEQHGLDINTVLHRNLHLVTHAVQTGNVHLLSSLAELSFNVWELDSFGNTLVHRAAIANQPDVLAVLLRLGHNLDEYNVYGYTPLLFCIKNGSHETLEKLLELGVSPDYNYINHPSPALLTLQKGDMKAFRLLLQYGANMTNVLKEVIQQEDLNNFRILLSETLRNNNSNLSSV